MWKKLMSAILIAALAVMTAACGGGEKHQGEKRDNDTFPFLHRYSPISVLF